MNKKILIVLVLVLIAGAVGVYILAGKKSAVGETTNEQVVVEKKTIIMVNPGGATYAQLLSGFENGLKENYKGSANLEFITKDAGSNKEMLKTMITETVAQKPAMIVTASSPPTLQALEETKESKIPILAVLGDPTKHGYIPSLQSSETNLTGIAQQSIELTPKRFEILRSMFPKAKRVAVFYDTTCGPTKSVRPIGDSVAKQLGFEITEFPLTNPSADQVKEVLAKVTAKEYDSMIFYPHGTLFSKSDLFLKKAKDEKLPLIMPDESSLAKGAVASYGPDFFNTGIQLSRLAVKVLDGIDPKEIPFEQANDIKFVVSLKSLKEIGVELPEDVIHKVDKVIPGE